jgi:nucleoside-specific outer membrane channel protein Tsx
MSKRFGGKPARRIPRMLVVAAGLVPLHAAALEWSATEVEFLHSAHFREPFNDNKVTKNIVTLQHADGYSLGRNFLFVDFARSGNQERDLGGNPEAPLDIYGEAYTTLSLSKATGKSFAAGPVRDIGLTAGINLGNKNSQLHPEPRVYLAGVTVEFAVPKGFFNVDLLGYWDHGCTSGGCPNYRSTTQITPSWLLPFSLGGIDGEFAGFIDFIGAHGGGSAYQVVGQPQLRFDVGKPLYGHKDQFYAGIEYQYWHNKYGSGGSHESHPQLLLVWKF